MFSKLGKVKGVGVKNPESNGSKSEKNKMGAAPFCPIRGVILWFFSVMFSHCSGCLLVLLLVLHCLLKLLFYSK